MKISNVIKSIFKVFTIIVITFWSFDLVAQHLFYISKNELTQEKATQLKSEIAKTEVYSLSSTKNNQNKEVYPVAISSVQNTKIVILNEQTGNNVVITPVDESLTHFDLEPFFVEELIQGVLGKADRYLVIETAADLSVRNVASVSYSREKVLVPRYFYGPKENVQEAFPKDREIVHIFKQKPRYIPAFPDDPENLRYVEQLEEEMSYYVYMYKLPDQTLCIYDDNFRKKEDEKELRVGSNLQFNLTGSMNTQQINATQYALGLWSEQLAGTIPVSINVDVVPMESGIIGGSYRTPNILIDNYWYSSPLGNQLVGYNFATSFYDIRLEMNSQYTFYYGTDANPPGSQMDWVTIMLHEVCHGLGFYSLLYSDVSGNYVYMTTGGSMNYTNNPGIYDRQLYQGTSGSALEDLTQSQRAALMTSNNLYAGRPGSNLLAANGGTRVRIYAPTNYAPGSSISHWDTSVTFPNWMRYAYVSALHTFNDRKIGIMLDMGWTSPTANPFEPVQNPAAQIVGNNAIITWEAPETSQTLTGYVVYRLQQGEPESNWTTLSSNVTQLTYTDNGWNSLIGGNYLYAIKAKYAGDNFSDAKLTNILNKPCNPISTFPYNEGFENNGTNLPTCWTQEIVTGNNNWQIIPAGVGYPSTTYGGTYKARLYFEDFTPQRTRLIMPPIDLSGISNPTLNFWHTQMDWYGDQDILRIYYKTSATGTWTLLQQYTNNIPNWTERTIPLPNGTADYYIAFEGETNYGYGIQLDNIQISGVPIVCNPPTNLTVNYTPNCNAQLSWTAPAAKEEVVKSDMLWDNTAGMGPNGYHGTRWVGGTSTARLVMGDDFDVPADEIWNINEVFFYGFTSSTAPQPEHIGIAIYKDNGNNRPQTTPIFESASFISVGGIQSGEMTILIPEGIEINEQGKYWISIYGAYAGPIDVEKQYYIGISGTSNEATMCRWDPQGMYGEDSPYVNWTPNQVTEWPSMAFSLKGEKVTPSSIIYNIYRNNSLIAPNISETTYTDTGFDPAQSHTWSVRVVCSGGTESEPVSITKEKCEVDCNAPTNLTVNVDNNTLLADISWDAPTQRSSMLWDNKAGMINSGYHSVRWLGGDDRLVQGDDFIVPAGETWIIDRVWCDGFYITNTDEYDVPESMGVAIYMDNGNNRPGQLVWEQTNLTTEEGVYQHSNGINIIIPTPIIISEPGKYWISIYAVHSGSFNVQKLYIMKGSPTLIESTICRWDPTGLYTDSPYINWAPNTDTAIRSMSFSLSGVVDTSGDILYNVYLDGNLIASNLEETTYQYPQQLSYNETYEWCVTTVCSAINESDAVCYETQLSGYTVSVSANPPAGGSPTGEGTYQPNESVTVQANPNSGYNFVHWTEENAVVSLNENYTFIVESDRNLTANFVEEGKYFVTLEVVPEGSGSAIGGGQYDAEEPVTITASESNTNYEFEAWFDGTTEVTKNHSYYFDMPEMHKTFTAKFQGVEINITASASPLEGGTIEGDGIYRYGETASLTAIANPNYTFENWTEGSTIVSTSDNYSFPVNSTRTLTANFKKDQYQVTYNTTGNGTLSVTANSNPITSGSWVDHGTTLTITANPAPNHHWSSIKVNGTDIQSDDTYIVISTTNIECTFAINEHIISVLANPSSYGTATGSGTYSYGTNATVSATAFIGYGFVNWTKNGTAVSSVADYTFSVTEDMELTANFAVAYSVSVSANPPEGGKVFGDGIYTFGANATVTAEANPGYDFDSWAKDGTVVWYEPEFTFAVNANTALVANFGTVNINNPTMSGIIVYGQSNKVHIINENNINLKSIEIMDLLGRVLYNGKSDSSTVIELNVSTGHYVVKTVSEEGVISVVKVYLTK